ncbi:glutathione S-transferase [Mollisia scopiformis]|uniref:Glutathione S-transferase n=1 Tax=Mollisia scopiformis TaxID=149040 RepID=A0A194WYF2_MOLSC|nr:glutathione S-transferase [Mollisia scopiformis]KUJ12991.1 glutathione S-transferase [Mollisia scopiformis]
MAPDLKFYYAPGACSLAPHILLHEVGAKYEPVILRIGATRTEFPASFKDVNPKMRVPTIVIDQEIITEIPSVCTAISQLTPSKNLMGKPGLENIRVLEWMNYLSGTLHGGGFGHLFRPGRFTADESSEAKMGVEKKAREAIGESLVFVEGRLRDGKWAVGEQMTTVDVFLLVFWRWGVAYRFGMEKYPRYRALMERLNEVESVKETLEFEKIKAML